MNRPANNAAEAAVARPVVITTGGELVEVRATAEAALAPLPGAELVDVPGLGPRWAYVDRRPDQAAPAPAVRAIEPLPMWVKAAALLMPSTAVSVAVGAWGLSLAVEAFEAIAAALWALAGAAVAGGLVLGGVARAVRGRRASGPATVTATATATSRGLLGRATATATATVER